MENRDKTIQRFYDELASRYEQTLYSDPTDPDAIYQRYRVAFDKFEPNCTRRVLELGSGTGVFTVPIAQRIGGAIYATDLSFRMLKVLVEKQRQVNLKNVVVSGVCNFNMGLPFKDELFDRALFAFCLNEGTNRKETLQEVYRVLVPSGRVVIVDMEGGDALVAATGKTINELLDEACGFYHPGFPNKKQWQELLKSAGFRNIEVQIIKKDNWTVLGHNFDINLCVISGAK